MIAVFLSNSCDAPPKPDRNGEWPSKKRGNREIGVGIRTIRQIIARHGGEYAAHYDEEKHHMLISFVLIQKEREEL